MTPSLFFVTIGVCQIKFHYRVMGTLRLPHFMNDPSLICLVLLSFFQQSISHFHNQFCKYTDNNPYRKGMAQNFTRGTRRGVLPMIFFGACRRKFSQILKKIPIGIVTVSADNSAPRAITVITDYSYLQITVCKNEKQQGNNNM